ncbi:MAG: sigma-54-dependent Fis family transcriptional regulator, partial [Candidatus Rokubacteria bacterium]|nr:sigma-54-dependent Fis family transcriptional regulator [Candidatus Rokubacteria bacterium]
DEIGELSPALQAKLLRVLQDHTIRRVGGNELIPVDVRVIAATNRDLQKLLGEGAFREDLYYRLNAVTIAIPPLRDRSEDIPLLAQHFLEKYAGISGRRVTGFAQETLALLSSYGWPGNVRELEHTIERAVALASSEVVFPADLPSEVGVVRREPPRLPAPRMTLDEVKRWYVAKIVEEVEGNKLRAAEILGIDRRTLYRILGRREVNERPTP